MKTRRKTKKRILGLTEQQWQHLETLPRGSTERTYFGMYCEQLWVHAETGRDNIDLTKAVNRPAASIDESKAQVLRWITEDRA